ncbi:hypothetical protein [uncultured Trichococcus sp.]|uniref:hypothetical protein n=1 Tax=uncultured Trichococcus sp. TaxID=189665 RepID=UPI0029C60924|nr:hypothetical protein [uncultured Trichococcus sp.]
MKKEKSLGYFTELFMKDLIKALYELSKQYSKIGIDLKDVLPVPFNNLEKMHVKIYYYKKYDKIEFELRENKGYFSYEVVYGDSIRARIHETDDRGRGSIFHHAEPYYDVNNRSSSIKVVAYGMYFSFDSFVYRLNNIDELALEIVKSFVGPYIYHLEGHTENYLIYLKFVANNFLKLIMDENTPELVIDKFLEVNSIILKEGLGLEHLIHQATLENVLDIYPHDLKPDLIGFNMMERRWEIIDYKKSNRGVLKNIGRTRTGFTAEVHSLGDQLRDYCEYFGEKTHRDYVKNKYKVDIEYPTTVGVIGLLEKELERDFNRIIRDEPRWFKVVPYNYLYNNFVSFIKNVENINGGVF